MTDKTLGWLGTGRMGAAMSRRLVDAGKDVTVWNRTRAKTDALAAALIGACNLALARDSRRIAGCLGIFLRSSNRLVTIIPPS